MSRRAGLLCLALTLACVRQSEPAAAGSKLAARASEPAHDEARADADALRRHVERLAGEIGDRDLDHPEQLAAAIEHLRTHWRAQGYAVRELEYRFDTPAGPRTALNLEIELPGRTRERVVVGAHYDTCDNPGADDNASGVALLLELSRLLAGEVHERTIVFVAFANEEPPYFRDDAAMGSRVYARGLREQGIELAAMLSLESVGYFSDAPGSQHYPAIVAPLYPDTGNFVAVVGKTGSRPLVRRVVRALEAHGSVPVESIAAPATITGIDWSDHASFWAQGWPQAVMITDTATFRNPHYHQKTDRPDTLDYRRMAALADALAPTIRELANAE